MDSATYKAAIDAAILVLAREAAMFNPHAQDVPNMTILVDAGSIIYNGGIVAKSQQTTPTITAPVSNPRIDLVVIDGSTATVAVVTGVEAGSPAVPALPSGKFPIAQISLTVGMTQILNTSINDLRVGFGGSAIIDAAANIGSLRTIGTGALQACAGNDSRLTAFGNGTVSQSKLKTSSGAVGMVNTASDFNTNFTLPGGQYGFYPQLYLYAPDGLATAGASLLATTSASLGTANYIYLTVAGIIGYATMQATQTYVTSSGEVYWIYLLWDKKTKVLEGSHWMAPDHPCFGRCGKPGLVPHPFTHYDSNKHEIVVIHPTPEQVDAAEKNCIKGEEEHDLLISDSFFQLFDIDENSNPGWPTDPVTTGITRYRNIAGNMVKATPEALKTMPEGTPIEVIKKVIPKPDYIIVKSFKPKGAKI